MTDVKGIFTVITRAEKQIDDIENFVCTPPKQTIIGIGEYPIKRLLKAPGIHKESILPIFMGRSSDDIHKWISKGQDTHLIVGFADSARDTHLWYDVLPIITKDNLLITSLKERAPEKLHSAIIFSSIWDGIGSASLPTLIGKFRAQTIDSLSIAILPSKVQAPDAHFNAYATLQMSLSIDGATVLLLGRDQLESYEGVDRKGVQIKGELVVNYLLDIFLSKDSLVQEITELARTFNIKIFSAIAITAASYRIYGSIENMLNVALLKPLLSFDLSTTKLLYVLLRIPLNLKDKINRAQIELAITKWFKEKTSLQSIHISEPIFTEDMNDRIDAVLFAGGFDMCNIFASLDQKAKVLKSKAVEKGFMTEDGHVQFKVEEEIKKTPETPARIVQIMKEEKSVTVPIFEIEAALSILENIEEIAVVEVPKSQSGDTTIINKTLKEYVKPKKEPEKGLKRWFKRFLLLFFIVSAIIAY